MHFALRTRLLDVFKYMHGTSFPSIQLVHIIPLSLVSSYQEVVLLTSIYDQF
jgi:hypothetical protein